MSDTITDTNKQEKALLDAVRNLSYGSVEVVVHDGQIMEIIQKQRTRFSANEKKT